MLTSPRYEARIIIDPVGPPTYAVFDTFVQAFCIPIGEQRYNSMAQASVAASRMNGAYERAIAS
jgi:hypothetical protein